jgi:hypothetical protein
MWRRLLPGLLISIVILVSEVGWALDVLGNEDDAGSGIDAGDSFDAALPLTFGSYEGNVSLAGDLDDYYKLDLVTEELLNIVVHSALPRVCLPTNLCVAVSACAVLELYGPDQSVVAGGLCGTNITCGCYESSVTDFVPTLNGTWFVRISAGVPNTQVPKQLYSLSITLNHAYLGSATFSFEEANVFVLDLFQPLALYSIGIEVDRFQLSDLATSAFGELFFGSSGTWHGFISMSSAFFSDRPEVHLHTGLLGFDAGASPGLDALPTRRLLWTGGNASQEALRLVVLSDRPFRGNVSIAYDGSQAVRASVLGREAIISETSSGFDAALAVQTPVGGYLEGARLNVSLPSNFAGIFRLSPLVGLPLEESTGDTLAQGANSYS